ncbi:MAG: peptidoglycan-binding protein [Myxococcaceae bacterium]
MPSRIPPRPPPAPLPPPRPSAPRPPAGPGTGFQSRISGFDEDANGVRGIPPEPPPPPPPYLDLVGLHRVRDGGTPPDREKVGRLQDQLVALGFLPESALGVAQADRGTFGGLTEAALKDFQRSQNLPATGEVDYATAVALGDPRPAVAPELANVAAGFSGQLGRPTGEPETLDDGTVRQRFDGGYVEKLPDGSLHVSSTANDLDVTYKAGDALAAAEAGGGYVDQMAGDPNKSNANCGFASALMALNVLGLDAPDAPEGAAGTGDYPTVMNLRDLGGGGTDDTAFGTPTQVVSALTQAGANAAIVQNTWGSDKSAAVDVMRQAFLDPSSQEAFVVAGNPTLGWDGNTTYDGSHFVTVVGYDPVKDVFIVMDPYSTTPGPFEVSAADMAAYMEDGGTETGELIRVTAPPPETASARQVPIAV